MKNINSIISNSFRKVFILSLSCLLAVPMTTAYAKDNAVILKEENSRKKGELIKKGEITLNDAALALEAALGITALEGDSFWAADLLDEGAVSLENAQIILNAALGIEEVESALLKNGDYLVKNYLSVDANLYREVYHPGNNISFRFTIKNNAAAPFFAAYVSPKEAWIESVLVDENDEIYARDIIYSKNPIGSTGQREYFLIQPDESYETYLTIFQIPQYLKTKDLSSKKFYIKVKFSYTDAFNERDYIIDDYANYGIGYGVTYGTVPEEFELKYYTVKFPVNITNEE